MRTVDITKLTILEIEHYLQQRKIDEQIEIRKQKISDEVKKLYDKYKNAKFIAFICPDYIEFGEVKIVHLIETDSGIFNQVKIIFKTSYLIYKGPDVINLKRYPHNHHQSYINSDHKNRFIITIEEYKKLVNTYKKLEKNISIDDFNIHLNDFIKLKDNE